MVRYLSPEWFARLRELGATARGRRAGAVVLRHLVSGGPDGDVAYDVVLAGGGAAIEPAGDRPPDLTFLTDYPTASAIAAGTVSTHAALSEGRLRVRGDVSVLSARTGDLPGGDVVPDQLRAETRY